jgi:hypothetical protein
MVQPAEVPRAANRRACGRHPRPCRRLFTRPGRTARDSGHQVVCEGPPQVGRGEDTEQASSAVDPHPVRPTRGTLLVVIPGTRRAFFVAPSIAAAVALAAVLSLLDARSEPLWTRLTASLAVALPPAAVVAVARALASTRDLFAHLNTIMPALDALIEELMKKEPDSRVAQELLAQCDDALNRTRKVGSGSSSTCGDRAAWLRVHEQGNALAQSLLQIRREGGGARLRVALVALTACPRVDSLGWGGR